jgi:hypothetical protein
MQPIDAAELEGVEGGLLELAAAALFVAGVYVGWKLAQALMS